MAQRCWHVLPLRATVLFTEPCDRPAGSAQRRCVLCVCERMVYMHLLCGWRSSEHLACGADWPFEGDGW